MFKKVFLISSLIAGSAINAASGFYFLRTEKSPAVISTAQTFYLFRSSPENSAFNPAAAGSNDLFAGKAAYTSLFEKADATQITAHFGDGRHSYGTEISYLNIAGLEGRYKPSEDPMYEFDSKNLIFSLNYAYEISDGFTAGVSGKYLFEKIEFEESYGFAASFGLFRICSVIEGLNLGLSLNNFGKMGRLEKERTDLPLDVLVGAGYTIKVSEDIAFRIANSTRYLIIDKKTENFSGLEFSYLEKVFFRTGYRSHNEGSPFSFGLGFEISDIIIDYSFTPFSDDAMDHSHSFSVGYSLK